MTKPSDHQPSAFDQEAQFIAALEQLDLHHQDIATPLANLSQYLTDIKQYIDQSQLDVERLAPSHPLATQVTQYLSESKACLPVWQQARDDLQPALNLADAFADKVMLLVFGKFNAGKSSFCNLIADRFKHHQKTVQAFTVDAGALRYHDEAFKSGNTETTVEIQGVILADRLVLIDTPGLHSVNVENADLTQQFLESADGILWLSSSTSPGQVQELEELAQELRRRKPLVPIITRSDFLDEDIVDNAIVKILCNKSPENRQLQQEDVLLRAQDKLRSLEMDPQLVRPAISVSVHSAREHGLDDDALRNAGIYEVYQGILQLIEAIVDYKSRKPLEIMRHYTDEVVLTDLRRFAEEIQQLNGALEQHHDDLSLTIEAIKTQCWETTMADLPQLLDQYIDMRLPDLGEPAQAESPADARAQANAQETQGPADAQPSQDAQALVTQLNEQIQHTLEQATQEKLQDYVVPDVSEARQAVTLRINYALTADNYERLYNQIEQQLQTALQGYGEVLLQHLEDDIITPLSAQLNAVDSQLQTFLSSTPA